MSSGEVAYSIPNQETIEAMLEADEIAHDPNVKGYTSIDELREALEADNTKHKK